MPADLGREVVGDEQVLHARPRTSCRVEGAGAASSSATSGSRAPTSAASRSSRPSRRAAQTAWARSIGSRSPRYRTSASAHSGVRGVGRVAERDQRVPAQPPRIAPGDVPAPVIGEQRVVVGGEQLEQRHPRACGVVQADAGAAVELPRPGMPPPVPTLAAISARPVAAAGRPPGSRRSRRCESPSASRCSRGNVPGACTSQARQRPASTTPGATIAAGRAAVEAPAACAAPSATGASLPRQRRVGHDAAEHEPRAQLRAAAGWRSCRTSRARRGARPPGRRGRCRRPAPGPVAVPLQVGRDGAEGLLQRAVVVRPGIAGNRSVWAPAVVGPRREDGLVATGADHDGGGALDQLARRRRADRPAEGEVHAGVQTGGLALLQGGARSQQRLGRGDADRVEPMREPERVDLERQLVG